MSEIEDAPTYLGRQKFKELVEWLTAEVILNRPGDPFPFLRDLLDEKIEQRMGAAYSPDANIDYLKDCYAEASKNADESGCIKPRSTPRRPKVADTSALVKKIARYDAIMEASRDIAATLDPMDATTAIVKATCNLLGCDRATLFSMTAARDALVIMTAKGVQDIFLPLGQGIAGSVAANGELINIPDAYKDDRFDSQHDVNTGYKTRTILAAPVKDSSNKIVGVIQAINRKPQNDGEPDIFDAEAEEVIQLLANQAGVALNNANMYYHMNSSQLKVRGLVDIIKSMHSNLGINSLMFTITQRAHSLVEADRCTMFLVDAEKKELWSLQGEVDLRFPMTKGIAGECCTTGKTINIKDAYEDTRFNQEVDKKSGYKTKTMLCMPCLGSDGTVVGCIQVINKSHSTFDREDEEIMESFLSIVGPVLQQSQLFQRSSKDDGSTEFTGKNLAKTASKRDPAQQAAPVLEEGDEDDDDDDDDES